MFPFTRVPFWVHIFDPQPYKCHGQNLFGVAGDGLLVRILNQYADFQ